jgi:hypothetical protein
MNMVSHFQKKIERNLILSFAADMLPQSRFYVTDKAVYLSVGENETQNPIAQKKRLPFDQILRVESESQSTSCGCCYPSSPSYGEVYIASNREHYVKESKHDAHHDIHHHNVHHQNVHHHHSNMHGDVHHHHEKSIERVDDLAISYPLVYHHDQVIKVLIFLRDKTKEKVPIDWDSVKNELRPYTLEGNQWDCSTN